MSTAVTDFWQAKNLAAKEKAERGAIDQGNRGTVTAGKHMTGFSGLVKVGLLAIGVPEAWIHLRGTEIPGFFRSSKDWDLLVVGDGKLLAVLEFKSQAGSFGNNVNNRAEEAL